MMQKEEQEERKSIIKSLTLKWDFKHMIDLKATLWFLERRPVRKSKDAEVIK